MPGFSPGLAQALAQQPQQPQQPQQEPDLERWRRLAEQMAGPAEMRSYAPSLRERMGNWVYDTLSGLGMPSQAEHTRGVVETGADFVPGLGNTLTGEEAGRAFGEGNYGEAGLLGAAALVPIPAAGKVAAKGVEKLAETLAERKGIRAYHGSPHSFDKFELSPRTIGTGEGAQAYGHGLYFGEQEAVGKEYRDRLTSRIANEQTPEGSAARALDLSDGDPQAAIETLTGNLESIHASIDAMERHGRMAPSHLVGRLSEYEDAIKLVEKGFTGKGHMYEVDIGAEPEQFLDWDKPLSQQHPAVQEALGYRPPPSTENVPVDPNDLEGLVAWADKLDARTGEDAYRGMTNETYPIRTAKGQPWGQGGKTYEESLAMAGGDPSNVLRLRNPLNKEQATEALRQKGIPGIKFLDQGSRFNPANLPDNPIANEARQFLEASGGDTDAALKAFHASNPVERFAASERDEISKVIKQGGKDVTHNYVVFDDKLISILRKYGMGGMVGTAAGYEMAQQLMQQENERPPPVRGINPTQPTNSRLAPLLMQQLPQTAPWSPNAT